MTTADKVGAGQSNRDIGVREPAEKATEKAAVGKVVEDVKAVRKNVRQVVSSGGRVAALGGPRVALVYSRRR